MMFILHKSRSLLWILLALAMVSWSQNSRTLNGAVGKGSKVAMAFSDGSVLLLDTALHEKAKWKLDAKVNAIQWQNEMLWVGTHSGVYLCTEGRGTCEINTMENKKLPVFAIISNGRDIWLGSETQVVKWVPEKKQEKSWKLPKGSGRVTALLLVGNMLYVGTEKGGVQVLDPSRGKWRGFDRFDGMPAGEIVGLAMIGRSVMVATIQGIGRIDLLLDAAEVLDSTVVVTSSAHSLGRIYVSTLDGVMESSPFPSSLKWRKVEGSEELFGAMVEHESSLYGANENGEPKRIHLGASVLGISSKQESERVVLVQKGTLKVPSDSRISARVWYPESPRVIVDAQWEEKGNIRRFYIPDDVVGVSVLEIALLRKDAVIERLTIQLENPNAKPSVSELPPTECANSIASGVSEIEYVLRKGETLRILAERFYGDRDLYFILMEHNQVQDEETYHLPIGLTLKIPVWQGFVFGVQPWKDAMEAYRKAVGK